MHWLATDLVIQMIVLAVGCAAVVPLLLSKSFRTWFFDSDWHLEHFGFVIFVLAVVAAAVFKQFVA